MFLQKSAENVKNQGKSRQKAKFTANGEIHGFRDFRDLGTTLHMTYYVVAMRARLCVVRVGQVTSRS